MLNTTKYCRHKSRRTTGRVKAKPRDWIYILFISLIFSGMISLITTRLSSITISPVLAQTVLTQRPQQLVERQIVEVEVEKVDERVLKIRKFLDEEHSPLAPYAQLIVDQADEHDIGFTKLVAIACMESACGRQSNYFNAWGLGGSNFIHFESWEQSIKFTSTLLGDSYKRDEYRAIKERYCPASDGCNPNWVNIVVSKSKDILKK